MAEQKQVTCPFCGRPVPPRKGTRGSNRTGHSNCNIIASRLVELQSRIEQVRWQDETKIKRLKGDLFAMSNQLFNAKADIKFAPDSDEEFEYVIPETKKRNKKKHELPTI